MFIISKEANPNYLCKVVKLENLRKHPNADKLQVVNIDYQQVITGLGAKEGDIYIYFPLECKINKDFLSFTNSFRHKELNLDVEKIGFFEDNCRVRAVRLRGEKSMGYIVPILDLEHFLGVSLPVKENSEFDVINNIKLVEKYVIKEKESGVKREGKKPQLTRLIDGQVRLHVDTENLRKNIHKINSHSLISITYKTHGTSFWVSNVLVKKKLNFLSKIFKFFGVNIITSEYDLVYGSRKVVKNKYFEDPKASNHYYGYDLWEKIKDELAPFVPKGYTIYGEFLGYGYNGEEIQKDYHYGCNPGEHKIEIYRITNTNVDGIVTELSTPQIIDFCNRYNLTSSHLFFYGFADSKYPDMEEYSSFISRLEKEYNEKDCFKCTDKKVPEEGIVLRVENLNEYLAYKLKSFSFLERETNLLDQGELNIEDNG